MRRMTADQVRETLRRACAGNQARWAAEHGFARSYVTMVLRGQREPTDALLDALGLERVITPKTARK